MDTRDATLIVATPGLHGGPPPVASFPGAIPTMPLRCDPPSGLGSHATEGRLPSGTGGWYSTGHHPEGALTGDLGRPGPPPARVRCREPPVPVVWRAATRGFVPGCYPYHTPPVRPTFRVSVPRYGGEGSRPGPVVGKPPVPFRTEPSPAIPVTPVQLPYGTRFRGHRSPAIGWGTPPRVDLDSPGNQPHIALRWTLPIRSWFTQRTGGSRPGPGGWYPSGCPA